MSAAAPHAVFLSYAHEDADAARRIAEALRGFGVEVWFDQSELRGGDAWDQKIRQQIKECALFAPIISAHTEARGEGYFRLEWKLADERTHLMAKGVPFLLPVVVDATAEGEAMVPDSFRTVQWTRLPAGAPSPEFAAQVKHLLASPRKSAAAKRPEPAAPPPSAPAAKSGLPLWATAALGAAVLALVAYIALRPGTKETSAGAPAKSGAETKGAPSMNEKSLAVLPFENLSPDKENEFFTSGIHEEILTALQTVRELHVIQYRGAQKTMRQVGEELTVAYALECSVRRAGTKVRVTGKLTNTRTEEQKWAETFEGDLTDVFAIQSSLAKTIAAKLSAELSPVEKDTIERRSTTSVAAYDLYLKARDARSRAPNTQDATSQTEALLLQAVKLDPQFALAWGELAFTHGFRYSDNQDRSESRLARARAALETMKRLAPGDPETLRQEGNFYYFTTRDYPRAMDLFTQALALRPNDPESYYSLCQVQRRQGRWAECMENFRKAIALDPQNDRLLRNAAYTLGFARHYDEELALEQRRVELSPASEEPKWRIAFNHFRARGATAEGDRETKNVSVTARIRWAGEKGDFKEILRLEPQLPRGWDFFVVASLIGLRDEAGARKRVAGIVEQIKSDIAREPTNAEAWISLAEAQSVQGRHDEALASGKKAMDLLPESIDAWRGPELSARVAALYARAGQIGWALSEFARLLRNGGANVHELRAAPLPAAFKNDPRFQALLNDPQNNAPLF